MRSKYDNIHTVNYIMIKQQVSIFIYYAPRIFFEGLRVGQKLFQHSPSLHLP